MHSGNLSLPARTLGCILAAIVTAGCIGDRMLMGDGESGDPNSTSSTSAATSGTGTSAAASTSTSSNTTSTGAVDETSTTGSPNPGFLPVPDVGDSAFQCDIFTQDCPVGQKCTPYNSESPEIPDTWDGWRCTPLAEDPVPPGEPCHTEGGPTSGIDDCELGAMCYSVDPDTLEGACVNLCMGSADAYFCEDPSTVCEIETGGPVLVCLPICDPVVQDCPAGQACYPIQEDWFCRPDASGDLGAYGDPCEFITVCDPGLICLDASTVPPGQACEGAAGCCTEVCDITDPAGDMQCTGAAEGQACVPWYEDGEAPPRWEDVGACMLPQ
jgi:hypothetical protein